VPNRPGSCFIFSIVFGTVTLTPFLIEAAVKRREPENPSENWINDARRRLADWRGKKPETKAGQIWALWPEIRAAIEDGQSIKSIRAWLEEEVGVVVTADSLRSYVGRCRAKESGRETNEHDSKRAHSANPVGIPSRVPAALRTDTANDPMAVARRALNKSRFDIRKIHGDGDPSDRNLI
jgi:hypothetical protein